MKAPFVYFGGKAQVASTIWQALGQPAHYIEPFFGSGAVLLARQGYKPGAHIETVCDVDGYVANVWRAMQSAPDEVARWCDWPVNHADLSARRRRLLASEANMLEHLTTDDEWYDAKLAGYWIWAASCWIGSGLTRINAIPHLGDAGTGVHAIGQIPHVGNSGMGVHTIGQRPHLSNSGMGVHTIGQRPHLSDSGMDVQGPYNTHLYTWFRALSERLRYVRVVCGDWTRVCGGDWQDKIGTVGIFFDPPYGSEDRDDALYHCESMTVAADVAKWALERGDRPSYRIVVAGYDDEHAILTEAGWRVTRWKAGGGYAGTARNGETQAQLNRHRECLWLSPHCLGQRDLFSMVEEFES